MTNRSFSDLSISQRRERLAAVLQRVLDQKAKISASPGDPSLKAPPDLRLSVSHPENGEPDDGDEA